ncbi:CCA tRNA nucleotidyltransferase [Salinirubrum litoreum]|uniref:CCA-adding enzyme n=1 Tax=Salinirubrum litoreum TaxID=1126234 RepID=A0ABD5RF01_9EURY|nr:CCA tRNA nucleotidyltransferase [Salinirubrum litoreum]
MTDLDAVVARVRDRIDPSADERQRMADATATLLSRVESATADLPVPTDAIQVGSTARGTWLSGDRDIDLFVRFPPDLDRETLERYGLQVGHAVLPDGHEEYAEHPYVKGEFEGFEVDLVPCYDVDDASEIQSAVDRTPFHTEYLRGRLTDDLAADVRVCKRFLKGIGAYGSNLRTRGFSGYLTELLVVEYGGFRPLLDAASDWQPPVELDPEDHGTATFDDPLVVIDPTDPERNVAAVCAPENVARLQHYARDLLATPREDLFFPPDTEPLAAEDLRRHLERRGTTPVAVVFETPDIVADQLYPQLRRSLSGVRSELDRRGFDVLRATTFADDRAVLLCELEVAERPAIQRHGGPPVHVREHAEGFFGTYADGEADSADADDPPAVYGPFLDGDRFVVERDREFTSAADFLRSDALFDVALGTHVATALDAGYDVLVGDDLASLTDEFGVELAGYFDPKP